MSVCVCACAQALSHVQLFVTALSVAHQAPLSMEFCRQEYWSGLPFPSLDLPDSEIKPVSPASPAFQADSLPLSYQGPFQFNSVQSLSRVRLCDPMNCSMPQLPVRHQLPEFTQTHAHRVGDASSHLILCRPFLLLPPIPPSVRVFSNEPTLRMRWPKYWSFSF